MSPDVVFQEIELGKLKLDPTNPRLPKSLHGGTEAEILKYMLLDGSLIELILAIGGNGFFPGEQLLVVAEGDSYKVVEGNRRLSAVKILNDPTLADVQKSKVEKAVNEATYKPSLIPCLIFKEESEIHNYLGYRHVTGVKPWRLLEKARYLYDLRINRFAGLNNDVAYREIAKTIGSRQDYVKRILVGFDVYKLIEDSGFYKIKDLDDTTFYFNYIADSIRWENISSFLGVNLELANSLENINTVNLKKWTHWLFEKNPQNKIRVIGDSSNLKALNQILANVEATQAFDTGESLERARELTGEINSQFRS